MKKLLVIILLFSSLNLMAQKPDRKIEVVAYAGIASLQNTFFEAVDFQYTIKRHSISIGPYFTKTYESNMYPGLHLGYQFTPRDNGNKFQSFFSFDYLYFNGLANPGIYDEVKFIRHMFNFGYGINVRISKNIFLTSNIGIGPKHMTDKSTQGASWEIHKEIGLSSILRLGVGYTF